jgi:hypothetical protein
LDILDVVNLEEVETRIKIEANKALVPLWPEEDEHNLPERTSILIHEVTERISKEKLVAFFKVFNANVQVQFRFRARQALLTYLAHAGRGCLPCALCF